MTGSFDVQLRLETGYGSVTIALRPDWAPLSVAHVFHLVTSGVLVEGTFYRAQRREHWVPGREFEVLQGGLAPNELAEVVAHEPPPVPFVCGTVGLARFAPGTACSELFITLGDSPALAAGAPEPMDGHGFAAIGQVVEGIDVIRQIHALPTAAGAGDGVATDQMLSTPEPFHVTLL